MADNVIDWVITDEERAHFARFSGDHNPIHTDPIAARRLHGGRLLVHGAHVLLGVVEQATAAGLLDATPAEVDVRFLHGVEPDEPLATRLHVGDGGVRATVTTGVWRAVDVTIAPGHLDPSRDDLRGCAPIGTPDVVRLEDLDELQGELDLEADPADGKALFPRTVGLLGPYRTAEVAQLSRVVGMHAPGLRSMSSRYRVSFEPPAPGSRSTLRYRVEHVDRRLRRVGVEVTGPSTRTIIDAFSPVGPIDQLPVVDGAVTDPNEFTGRRVLVIGGSRGVGAATVALLTAGGADVRFTYRVGRDDAVSMTDATGAQAFRLDVVTGVSTDGDVCGDGWRPTHLAWFATPPYGDGTTSAYSRRYHDELCAVQVESFVAMIDRLRHDDDTLSAVMWPSSALLDRPSAASRELADVKRRGETACDELATRHPGLAVSAPRLPLILTDQTTSLLPVEYADTPSTLLAVLRGQPD